MGIARISALRQQLQNLPVETWVGDAVALHTNEIEDMQREQLLSGRGKDGEKLEPKYKTGSYAKLKSQQNPEAGYGVPDLNRTGAYHKSIEARAYATQLEIAPTDFKAKYLMPRYPNAIGLNIIHVIRLQRELVLPELRKNVRALLRP